MQWIPLASFAIVLIGMLWKGIALTTRLEMTIKDLEEEVSALKLERKYLSKLPEFEKRLDQVEDAITEITATLRGRGPEDGIVARLRVIERKLSGEMRAVR